ncbi:MAG: CNP1-like family protein, partial [Zoogloeaceae bacterium]|nr:CNP1-like family protein [Zoogloeaceae bacterium]
MKARRSRSWRVLLAGVALCSFSTQAGFLGGLGDEEDYDTEKPEWKENEVALPPYPQDGDLISLYVSATAQNRFFVDLANLSVGSDGVVRYTLVVISPSGVRNVS